MTLERSTSIRRPLAAHIWRKDPDGFYVEPIWCSERLFATEKFAGAIWDPACGMGHIPRAAHRAGHATYATDIVNRGYQYFQGCVDFLTCDRPYANNIVCNPPFNKCEQFVRRALGLADGKVAVIWLLRRLNAAHWLTSTPLARIYLLTPRPSMPPGHVIEAGEKPSGGTEDFCWLVFSHRHKGSPELQWLHRDGAL
jgi:hypothetical protein